MFNRKTIFALAAISTVAAAALAPTSASARGGFGGGGFHGGGGGFARAASFHSPTFGSGGLRTGGLRNGGAGGILRNGGIGGGHGFGRGGGLARGGCTFAVRCGGGFKPPIVWHHPHPWPVFAWHHEHWGVGAVDYPVAVDTTVGATTVAAPTTAPCNCLTKEYLPDGSVLFKDLCTKEAAMATPAELKAQADGIAPTAQ